MTISKRHFVFVAAFLGFCAPVTFLGAIFAIRLHVTGYPSLDLESDLERFPKLAVQSGILGAWIAGLLASAKWHARAEFWICFILVSGTAGLFAGVAQSRYIGAHEIGGIPMYAGLAGAAIGAILYRWFASKRKGKGEAGPDLLNE